MNHIVIVGGGTGGIMTAARLLGEKDMQVTLLEPAEFHYYQPAWTLVGRMRTILRRQKERWRI